MIKIDLNKRQNLAVLIGAGVVAVVLFIVFVHLPLINKQRKLSHEIKRVEKDIQVAKGFIQKYKEPTGAGRLIRRDEIVVAIDEITQAGEAHGIDFISISPREIEDLKDTQYDRLPIELSLISQYTDLGLFLGALRDMRGSVIIVRAFDIERDEELLPLVKSTVMLEVYLKDG